MNAPNTPAGVDVAAWARALDLASPALVSDELRVQISRGFALVEDLHLVAASVADVDDGQLTSTLRRAAHSMDAVLAELRTVRAAIDPATDPAAVRRRSAAGSGWGVGS